MRQQKLDPILILMIILVAIVLALAVFLTVLFIQNRPPAGTSTVVVEGVEVTINMDPNQEVILVENPGQGGEATAVPPVIILPTDTPIPLPTETPIPPTPIPAPDQVIFVSHSVSSLDTLYSLSNQYNTTIPLMARFGVSSANLVPGNVISLAVANPAYCPGHNAYVVGEGETAFSISQWAGITLDEFRQINPYLDANFTIHLTDVVCIP
mgnify:FL=1